MLLRVLLDVFLAPAEEHDDWTRHEMSPTVTMATDSRRLAPNGQEADATREH
jgi:hypothetical protein